MFDATVRAPYLRGLPSRLGIYAEAFAAQRFFVWVWNAASQSFTLGAPAAGGTADGVTGRQKDGQVEELALRMPGTPVQVESGAAIGAGADIGTDAQGRAIPVGGGRLLGRALTAAGGAGTVIWAVLA